MSLERVEVTQEVLLAMLVHAHSTESEEVMGLLLGDIREEEAAGGVGGGGAVCRVSLAFPQIRTDRRKDRVESSPEQLARCSAHAERLSRETGGRVRVIGWYHSHPHITVLPSHVDVRTQAMYQLLDPGFVGLIVSAFNRDPASEASGVQSLPDGDVHSAGPGSLPGSALGPLVRRGVPVCVLPAASRLERSFADVMVVERTLLMEEHEVYKRALAAAAAMAAASGGGPFPSRGAAPSPELTELHHSGVYTSHMVRLLETCLRPALHGMAALAAAQEAQAEQLRAQIAGLEEQLAGEGPGAGEGAGSTAHAGAVAALAVGGGVAGAEAGVSPTPAVAPAAADFAAIPPPPAAAPAGSFAAQPGVS
ncbi:hypothetical protein GPECTOR_29g12 [Gonium pectorale]|uniref:MPN domain-containing protein n=1 Tax=Gonium pectorale TaxID=33097 RepID=A0A150GEF3_GONPE|nr:hypothetical protein GPECTOR_29g12 [Gonium pectorale]|eukprot:KXZ48214.1 hypothetical protein GPECTOR_29g12 [Gonium pectorale]